ncbi:MAG: LytTR family transcriptional regulator DNA-binding domain-containing protein [Lachnospiraceae bacterium]|nr:LytTR family transcriptional regulator DNA-binding domain-containing protein [Lachnospiraceae bacterium]
MITMAAYDENEAELETIKAATKELAARLTEDVWKLESISELKQFRSFMATTPLLDLMLYDVTGQEALELLQRFRKDYRAAGLLILADSGLSPMTYLKPDIHADSLLLRPWTREQLWEVLEEFIRGYLEMMQNESKEGQKLYIIETKEGKIGIPFVNICYFEAKEKKIRVCVGREEFAFYYTIDRLAEELPKNFIRCHRGFIVNSLKIRKVMLSQNVICLTDGLEIPLSRSYKADLKEWGK